jgi:type II secretory pathway pseudopilin PulG
MPLFLGAMWGRFTPYLIVAGVVAVALVLFVAKVFGAGKAAAKAEATLSALQRTREANAARANASRPVSKEEEANDPFNRDNR